MGVVRDHRRIKFTTSNLVICKVVKTVCLRWRPPALCWMIIPHQKDRIPNCAPSFCTITVSLTCMNTPRQRLADTVIMPSSLSITSTTDSNGRVPVVIRHGSDVSIAPSAKTSSCLLTVVVSKRYCVSAGCSPESRQRRSESGLKSKSLNAVSGP